MNAAAITRASDSNLALAFVSLSRERRQDMTVFYAFCRVIDDVADSLTLPADEKERQLKCWRNWARSPGPDEPPLAPQVRALLKKYELPPEMLDSIITGVEMDLHQARYATFEQLRVYCYHVASAVGLVSIEIFGYTNAGCKNYAVDLGLALQLTNIIRDVDRDLERNRIYLPEDDLRQFGYTPEQLARREYNDNFLRLMRFEAARAEEYFDRAAGALPREDRRSMVAAQIMASVYRSLLRRMQGDNFRVFEKEYRLNKWQKACRVIAQLLRNI